MYIGSPDFAVAQGQKKSSYDFLTDEEERRRRAKLNEDPQVDNSTPSGGDVAGFVDAAGNFIGAAGREGQVTQGAVTGATTGATIGATVGTAVGAAGAGAGAATGAASGSAAGPVGAVIGAVVGLTAGLLSGSAAAKKAKREAKLAATNKFYEQQQANQQRLAEGTTNQFSQLMRNYNQII